MLQGARMSIYMTKTFARLAARERISDGMLCEAIEWIRRGQIDADLGGGVIKQRNARMGGGRSAGFRTIILFRHGKLAFFVYGFSKKARNAL